ncbi:hypothetical protein [Campylobacter magnus]|nr:hypothetical protein [Campylobacter magnus]MDD0856182.1 hypothetical protein [Campylobacter magnus]
MKVFAELAGLPKQKLVKGSRRLSQPIKAQKPKRKGKNGIKPNL